MIRGYILDADGTLLDSMGIWEQLAQLYLQSQNMEAEENITDTLKTMTIPQSAAYLKQTYGIDKSVNMITDEIHELLLKQYEQNIILKEGVVDFLHHCHKKQIALCVLTANHEQPIRLALRRCGIEDDFVFMMSCEQENLDKNNPELYHRVIDKLGLAAEECMFVEDSLHAITCIKEAGYHVLAVYDKANEKDWQQICERSDKAVKDLSHWEV